MRHIASGAATFLAAACISGSVRAADPPRPGSGRGNAPMSESLVTTAGQPVQTPMLDMLDDQESVYQPIEPPKPEEGLNQGGVNVDVAVNYLDDYFYRGLAHDVIGRGRQNGPDLTFEGTLKFNLGKAPHPFVGVFANVYNRDPVSKFEEVRPYGGLEWTLRPVTVTVGYNSYIYPERTTFNTNELYVKLALDDSAIFHAQTPVFSPYIYAAYDYDKYHGTYMEFGIKHDFPFEEWGLVITPTADVGYSLGDPEFAKTLHGQDNGFQHYDAGVVASYSLDTLFNFSRRYGDFKLKGFLFYTDGIDKRLRADSQFWGGAGISFEY